MLKIAICDDDNFILEQLSTIVIKYCSENKISYIVNKYSSGEQLLDSYEHYNIIFLDIQMNGLDGIEIAKKIRNVDKHVKIIYVTNFLNYQADAFTVRAFGYVIKPFTDEIIFKQLDDVIEYSKQEKNKIAFTFNTNQGIRKINPKQIYLFEAYNHKVKITCSDQIYIINESIKDIFIKLKPFGFTMPHKSFVINMRYISKIKGYDIMLTNGICVPISQKRSVEFKSDFHLFLKNNFNVLF